jgi:hypothetical protein
MVQTYVIMFQDVELRALNVGLRLLILGFRVSEKIDGEAWGQGLSIWCLAGVNRVTFQWDNAQRACPHPAGIRLLQARLNEDNTV